MKNQKNERGITLVALVVTIVVLLILAGITIMYVMQGDSIFGTAKQAKTQTNDGVVLEVLSSAVLEAQSQIYSGIDGAGNTTTLKTTEAIGTFINDRLKSAGVQESTTATVTCSSFDTAKSTFVLAGSIEYKGTTYNVEVDTDAGKVSAKPATGTTTE